MDQPDAARREDLPDMRFGALRGKVKWLTWICGPELVLVEDVVDSIWQVLSPGELDYVTFTAGVDDERDIWAAAGQYPADPDANRLVVIRDADKLTWWDLPSVADAELAGVYLLLVSRSVSCSREIRALFRDNKGQVIRCTRPSEDAMSAWIRRQLPAASGSMVRYLLLRAGGDLAAIRAVCTKAAVFERLDKALIDLLFDEDYAGRFVDELLLLRKPQALAVAQAMPRADYARAIYQLESRLWTMRQLHVAARQRRGALLAAAQQGVQPLLAEKFLPVAPYYDPTFIRNCRRALVICDGVRRSADGRLAREAAFAGPIEGILELLVACWGEPIVEWDKEPGVDWDEDAADLDAMTASIACLRRPSRARARKTDHPEID